MEPHEARTKVMAQHEQLRVLMSTAEALARRFTAGEAVAHALDAALDELRAAWDEHNRFEEQLLEPLLAEGASVGARRIDRMREEHTEEHRVFTEALAARLPTIAHALSGILEELAAHMEAEERTFLDPRVLRR